MENLSILHLSDFHISAKNVEHIKERLKKVSERILPLIDTKGVNVIVVSGDIANHGKQEEFDLFRKCLNEFRSALISKKPHTIYEVIVPGNHDCDFDLDNSVSRNCRDTIRIDSEIDDALINELTRNQQNFYNLFNKEHYKNAKLHGVLNIKEHTNVSFHLFNTTTTAKKESNSGELTIIKKSLTSVPKNNEQDIRIAVFHHPLSWFSNESRKEFQNYLSNNFDLILHGHIHKREFSSITIDNLNTKYMQAPSFYGGKKDGFTFATIDLTTGKCNSNAYIWMENNYKTDIVNKIEINCLWEKSKQSKYPNVKILETADKIIKNLEAPFRHPRKATLENSDLFIYPDLLPFASDKEAFDNSAMVSLEKVITKKDFKLMIVGEEQSSKSTICKYLFEKELEESRIPILISPQFVNANDMKGNIDTLFKCLFSKQYSNIQNHEDIDYSDRTLIIDDLERLIDISKNMEKITKLIECAPRILFTISTEFFSKSFLFKDDYLKNFSRLKLYDIKPFGVVLRRKLIKKWICLQNKLNEDEINKKTDLLEKVIGDVMAIQGVPHSPVYILTSLQATEMGVSITNSTFVHHFEYLINTSIAQAVEKVDWDGIKNYSKKLAYHFYENSIYEINEENFVIFHKDYNKKYLLNLSFKEIKDILIKSQIITLESDSYNFKFKYCYYYFVALEINAMPLENRNIYENIIEKLCNNLYLDDNLNILMFITMNTKDKHVFEQLLLNSLSLYENVENLNLLEDTKEFEKLSKDMQKLVLPPNSAEENKDELRKQKDSHEEEDEEINKITQEKAKSNKEIRQYIMSLRTIKILGTILKTYAGSLDAQLKKDIGTEILSLPQRVQGFLFRNFNEDRKEILDYIRDKIVREEIRKFPKKEQENLLKKEEYSNISYERSQHIAKRFVYDMYNFFHYILIRVTSVYVGEYSLEPLFKLMEDNMNSLNDKLLFLAIFLEYKNSIPEQRVRDIEKEVNNNSIALNTLRRLVFDFMYINDVPSHQRQSLCSLLNISTESEQKLLRHKKK
jgi:predicted MPP superfamily phosphohydrolase